MKYLLFLILLVTFSASAEPVAKKGSKEYHKAIAKERAAAHPKGSGIGTNKYNVNYNQDYSVNKYVRSPCCDLYKD